MELGLTIEVPLIAVRFHHPRFCRHCQHCDADGFWEESSRPLPHPPVYQVDVHGWARSGALEREKGVVPVVASGRRWQEQFVLEAFSDNYLPIMHYFKSPFCCSRSSCSRIDIAVPPPRHSRTTAAPLPCHRSATATCCCAPHPRSCCLLGIVTATVAPILQVLLLRVACQPAAMTMRHRDVSYFFVFMQPGAQRNSAALTLCQR